MPRDYLQGSSTPVPLLDSGERERLSFWRQHAVAIPAELLEITGWLSHAAGRGALTDTGGEAQPVSPGSRPSNVLFLVPPEGSRAYQNWEWCLNYLRTEQGRRRLVQQQVERAEVSLRSAEEELNAVRTAHEELDTRLRQLADEVRGAHHRGDGSRRDSRMADLRLGLAQARENLSSSRLLERRRETFRLRLQGLQDHLEPQVYPGLWGRVNAFLDLQALSVASVAGEEFRKVPRSLARVATRLERELAED